MRAALYEAAGYISLHQSAVYKDFPWLFLPTCVAVQDERLLRPRPCRGLVALDARPDGGICLGTLAPSHQLKMQGPACPENAGIDLHTPLTRCALTGEVFLNPWCLAKLLRIATTQASSAADAAGCFSGAGAGLISQRRF